jgi:hypothetical protein
VPKHAEDNFQCSKQAIATEQQEQQKHEGNSTMKNLCLLIVLLAATAGLVISFMVAVV